MNRFLSTKACAGGGGGRVVSWMEWRWGRRSGEAGTLHDPRVFDGYAEAVMGDLDGRFRVEGGAAEEGVDVANGGGDGAEDWVWLLGGGHGWGMEVDDGQEWMRYVGVIEEGSGQDCGGQI